MFMFSWDPFITEENSAVEKVESGVQLILLDTGYIWKYTAL